MRGRQRAGRRARRFGTSWASALMWAFVLSTLGFAVGVGLGLVVENPDLIARHARGESEEIPWAIDAVSEAGGAAAPNSTAEKFVSEVPVRESNVFPAALSGRARGSVVAGGFLVQVGAFEARESAENQVGWLREQGFGAWVSPVPRPGATTSWRVRLGPVSDRREAQRIARELQEVGLSTWVLVNDGEAGS